MKRLLTFRVCLRAVAALTLFGVLGYAGLAKLNDPEPASDFLTSLVAVRATWVVVLVAVVEISLAVLILSGAYRSYCGLIAAALFASFAVAHGYQGIGGGKLMSASCGCFGKDSFLAEAPGWVWIAGNGGLAMFGVVIASSPRVKEDRGAS